jgi:hypothetical protein
MKSLAIVAGIVILSSAMPAFSQTDAKPAPASPCQAQPDANGNAGNNSDGSGEDKTQAGSLTEKLDPCNGVLKPPPTGDSDMTEPAPNQGNTPIIKPGDVPPQPPKQ